YLKRILSHSSFFKGETYTHFVANYSEELKGEEMNDEELALVLAGHFLESDVKKHSSTQSLIGGSSSWENLTNFRNV
ncbi:hypothetical protein OAK75_09285, partial [Bacteriovoracales bacterium]|nr:hypothetical protein [Bacteriovoracales bacterium]